MAAASVRLAAPSLARMFDTWTLAVLGAMNSSAPISLLLRPATIRRSTYRPRPIPLVAPPRHDQREPLALRAGQPGQLARPPAGPARLAVSEPGPAGQ